MLRGGVSGGGLFGCADGGASASLHASPAAVAITASRDAMLGRVDTLQASLSQLGGWVCVAAMAVTRLPLALCAGVMCFGL